MGILCTCLWNRVYPIPATLWTRCYVTSSQFQPHTVSMFCCWSNIIHNESQAGLRESYECLASVPIACTARQMVLSSPWFTANKESGSPLQTALVCNSNPLMVARLPKPGCYKDSEVAVAFMFCLHCLLAGYLVSCLVVPAGSSSSIPADYVSAGHVLVSADRDRIC
ncbi:hypothetical protein Tco_0019744 [Tanacetum coccineum]